MRKQSVILCVKNMMRMFKGGLLWEDGVQKMYYNLSKFF